MNRTKFPESPLSLAHPDPEIHSLAGMSDQASIALNLFQTFFTDFSADSKTLFAQAIVLRARIAWFSAQDVFDGYCAAALSLDQVAQAIVGIGHGKNSEVFSPDFCQRAKCLGPLFGLDPARLEARLALLSKH